MGKHTTEKPVLAKASKSPKVQVIPSTSAPVTSSSSKESCSRCKQGFFCSDHGKHEGEILNVNLKYNLFMFSRASMSFKIKYCRGEVLPCMIRNNHWTLQFHEILKAPFLASTNLEMNDCSDECILDVCYFIGFVLSARNLNFPSHEWWKRLLMISLFLLMVIGVWGKDSKGHMS
uniref:Uncharacterized protein MANES_06G149000 n=1 Tax=Rhizophora mucronata TaxID=61149 RepID=A0A2P2JLD7_RHIMU